MPLALEKKLKKICKQRGMSKQQCNRYVYGALRKTGWKPSK